ncbi:ImmA/IrrE family metallo-endopeptidase, partial [Acinetobacter baumannii]
MSKALAYAPAVNTAKTNLPSNESDPFYGSISKHKYAEFSLCDKEGNPIAGSPVIRALLTDGDKSISENMEDEANRFASALLMPSKDIRPYLTGK